MKSCFYPLLLAVAVTAPAQQTPPEAVPQTHDVQANVNEVLLDLIVRDKKGKPVTDLKPSDLTIFDDGAKQTITSFRLVRGAEAISESGAVTKLDPLRQVRLVTLAFEAMGDVEQRKLARSAATGLFKGGQGTNEYYSVVVIENRLLVLQPFTNDRSLLVNAIERATGGLSAPALASQSDAIVSQLQRNLGVTAGVDVNSSPTAAATLVAGLPPTTPSQALQSKLASVMLGMLRMDAAAASIGARLSISAMKSMVMGLRDMPGRKSVLFFTTGLYVTPELDVPFRNLISLANRANVTFYSLDSRGLMTFYSADTQKSMGIGQNSQSRDELMAATAATAADINRRGAPATVEQLRAMETAELSGRKNLQIPVRDLAESTGGFLIADSNDLRVPLQRINEEIASYYEVFFNPHIQKYDGSFRKIAVETNRKDLVVHARSGYFALPPEARAAGLEAYELPVLRALADGREWNDVHFRSGAVLLQPGKEGTDVSVLIELPLHELQPVTDKARKTLNVHCSLGALVKNANGEVVQKLTRDRNLQVTADQLKLGNFVEKMAVTLPPGKYSLESAVVDRDSNKTGTRRSEFQVPPKPKGVGISSLTAVRSYTPNVAGLDAGEPFQYQGGRITPTLDTDVPRSPDAALRLFFTVYRDPAIPARPTVEIEFRQNGKALAKVPMPLPDADAQGRIPYVMTIAAASIPPGNYEVHATARQGDTLAETATAVTIEAK